MKKSKKLEIIQQKNDHISKKLNSVESRNSMLKQNYSSRLLDKLMTAEEINDKVRKLEDYEMNMIERLKNTHTK